MQGRQIEIITKDDQYDSGKTKTNTQELTQQDGVFAMFNVVGTPNNLAIRDDLGDACIPDLFLATGSQLWGDEAHYPWLIGSIPSYADRGGGLRRLPEGQQARRQGGDPRPERRLR